MSLESLYKEKAGLAWKYFEALSQIPRMSKYEDGVREWLLSIAKEEGWESRQDACGNVVLAIPGCGRHADADILILQGHMDMVCEKNADVAHDFHKDPIQLLIDGDWVTAEGTTLGADNGVAIALGLAIAKAALTDRRPLELLFTIDEETGLTGALELDPGILKGRQLLNLDSEEDDTFTIGCAGGLDMQFRFGKVKKSFTDSLTVKISGLRGGHSGINIHEERGHAIKLTGELFKALKDAGEVFELISMTAGNKRNAIPREAEIQLSGSTKARLDKISADLTAAYAEREADLKIAITEGPAADSCIDNRVIDFLINIKKNTLITTGHS